MATKTRAKNGLSKRCECSPRNWSKCQHPFYFEFYLGRKYRFSLDRLARRRGEKPPRTMHQAEAMADTLRGEIRRGVFVDPTHPDVLSRDAAAALTVGDLIDQYIARHVRTPGRRPGGVATMLWLLGTLRRTEIPGAHGQSLRFEAKPLASVVKADIEAVRVARLAQARPGSKGAGVNRLLARCRALFAWAVVEGFTDSTPFQRGGQAVVKLTKEAPRHRRLQPGEEEALLRVASPHLRDLMLAALATGARVGELLSLQWKDVRTTAGPQGQPRSVLVFHAAKTKTNRSREIPVGSKLAACLAMRQHGPDGQVLAPTAYVFGTVTGERVASIKKQWATAVLKAHGHTPTWTTGQRNCLSPESREVYHRIDLHFHDLRREVGSLIVEAGGSLLDARDVLGHSSVAQTNTYLQSTASGLWRVIERKEEHERNLAAARARGAVAPPEGSDATTTAPPDRVQ